MGKYFIPTWVKNQLNNSQPKPEKPNWWDMLQPLNLEPVQPMSKPLGKLYYMDYKIETKPVDLYLQYKNKLIRDYKNSVQL